MSFNKEMSIIAQNAGTTAANLYVALVKNRGDVSFDPDEYEAIRLHVFQGTLELAGAETIVEQFEGGSNLPVAGTTPVTGPSAGTAGPGGSGSIEVKFGKHRGKTIAEIYELDSGWLEWAADKANNDFIKQHARRYLASVGS